MSFETPEASSKWWQFLTNATSTPLEMDNVFAFTCLKYVKEGYTGLQTSSANGEFFAFYIFALSVLLSCYLSWGMVYHLQVVVDKFIKFNCKHVVFSTTRCKPIKTEVKRLEFDTRSIWRISEINSKFEYVI